MKDAFQEEEKIRSQFFNDKINDDFDIQVNDKHLSESHINKFLSNDMMMDVDGSNIFVGGGPSIQRDIDINQEKFYNIIDDVNREKSRDRSKVKNGERIKDEDEERIEDEGGENFEDEGGNEEEYEDDQTDEKLVISQVGSDYVASSKVDDYKYRPEVYISLSLYDWTRLPVKIKVSRKVNDKTCFQFLPGHGQRTSHMVKIIPSRSETFFKNFIGGLLPRCDEGDFEYYCHTMLALFKPWRSSQDLKRCASDMA